MSPGMVFEIYYSFFFLSLGSSLLIQLFLLWDFIKGSLLESLGFWPPLLYSLITHFLNPPFSMVGIPPRLAARLPQPPLLEDKMFAGLSPCPEHPLGGQNWPHLGFISFSPGTSISTIPLQIPLLVLLFSLSRCQVLCKVMETQIQKLRKPLLSGNLLSNGVDYIQMQWWPRSVTLVWKVTKRERGVIGQQVNIRNNSRADLITIHGSRTGGLL